MALLRSAPPGHVVAAIGLVATLAGCVGASDAMDVPEATLAPTSSDLVGGDGDVGSITVASSPETDPPTSASSSASTTAVTDSTSTAPPSSVPPSTDPVATAVGPSSTDAAPTTEPAADPFLRIGDEGAEVGIMQLKLRALEYLEPGYTESVFDRPTADALIDFQAQYGLVVDGIFGPETDRSLSAAAASVNPDG